MGPRRAFRFRQGHSSSRNSIPTRSTLASRNDSRAAARVGHVLERDPEEVARRAYELWEQRGRPNGSREEDWFRAESELSHPSEVPLADTAADKDVCEFSQR